MHRATTDKRRIAIPRAGIVAAGIVATAALATAASSCFGTHTNTCEPSGRRCPDGLVCDLAQDACITPGGCGDGLIDANKGEVCDDGNTRDGDGCNHDCTSLEVCGNNIVDVAEECDDGNLKDGDGCSAQCHKEACGNKILDPGEVCDDGNTLPDDGCSANCKSLEVCGNGITDNNGPNSRVHEDCDPLNTFPAPPQDTANCNNDCTSAICGDGKVNKAHGETCDPGMVGSDSPDCNKDCTVAKCGDRYTNRAAGEQCDQGSDNSDLPDAECRKNCLLPSCGDGIRDTGEDCDDGNDRNDDFCVTTVAGKCKAAICGDGLIRTVSSTDKPAEVCDKGSSTILGVGCDIGFHCNDNCSACVPDADF